MTPPRVDVLVINWNGMEHVHACFSSLLANDYPESRFVLVDNASTDGSADYVERTFGGDPRVEVLRLPENLGWSRANNVAMKRSLDRGADFVFLINNDTWTAPDAIARLVARAEQLPQAGALAPKMVLFDTPEVLNSTGLACSYIGCSWDIGLGRVDAPGWNEDAPIIGVCGGAAFFRAEALRKSGLLPEDFEIYLDDLELCLRIWDAGYEIRRCPDAVVRHKFSATMGQGDRARHKYYLNTRNRLRVILRNYPFTRIVSVLPAVLVGEARAMGRAMLEGETWRVSAHLRAWKALAGYLPEVSCTRKERRARGLQFGRFWPLITFERMFFRGAPLPKAGWYASRSAQGLEVRPLAVRAVETVRAGRLRVTLVNCYPHLGTAEVLIEQNGVSLARVCSVDQTAVEFDVADGPLDFTAQRLFFAEATGELADYGGWIALEPCGAKA